MPDEFVTLCINKDYLPTYSVPTYNNTFGLFEKRF